MRIIDIKPRPSPQNCKVEIDSLNKINPIIGATII